MFGVQFYPTPVPLIRQMVAGLDLEHKRVLDPGAGRGDILDFVKEETKYRSWGNNGHHSADLYAIELDADLRQVLLGKGYRVIDTNFLRYAGHLYFDVILMNPPFRDGAQHLLKAWEISQGAVIKCLLNAETLRTAQTQDWHIVRKLIEAHGSEEKLGQPFKKSDRPTDVEVVLVTLQDDRPREDFRLDFNPAKLGKNGYKLNEIADKELASADAFESYEAQHRAAVAAFKDLLEARQRVSYYLEGLFDKYKHPTDVVAEAVKEGSPEGAYHKFVDSTTKFAWDNLFEKTKLSNVTTGGVRREIEKMQAEQGQMSFTADNMQDLFDQLFLNREQIIVKCVLEAFDLLTLHYHENRMMVEGWKTNGAYLVGKRFILPNMGKSWGSEGLDWTSGRQVADLERALCFIAGKKFENILHVTVVYDRQSHYGQWVDSEFFETQLYKRGTLHFRWLDDDLRKEFNAFVGRHRWGQMPEKVKQGTYW